MENNQSPLLVKYLKNHVNNPSSKAFAPLAEAYRKIGQVDKALELLKKGLKLHPGYVSALVTLGKCHMDVGRHDLAYASLKSIADENIDNILLLKVFAEACEKTNRDAEAGQAYKYLLFLNPKDEYYRGKVASFEALSNDPIATKQNDSRPQELEPVFEHEDVDQWETQNFFGLQEVTEKSNEPEKEVKSTNPVMTMTLVDLYIEQGIYSKAEEVISHILKLEPENAEAKAKWQKLQLHQAEGSDDEGRADLMSLIDQKFAKTISEDLRKAAGSAPLTTEVNPSSNSKNSVYEKIEQRYQQFMHGINQRSQLIS